MSANKLGSQLSIAATRGIEALNQEVRDAIDALKFKAEAYALEAEDLAKKGAAYLEAGLSGELEPSIALEAALRETGALELLALKAVETGAQEALRRTKKAIDIALEIGFKLIAVAL